MRHILLIFCCLFHNVFLELFTTYVNFEKYYQMEEELITLTELIINQEKIIHGEDIHGMSNISSFIEETKTLHGTFVDNPEDYLSHPINTFRLSVRLAKQWKDVTQQIMETDTCVKTLRVKLQNLEDHIPNDEQLSEIAMSILNLDKFYNLTVHDFMVGEINGHMRYEPLHLGDVVFIAKTAYDKEQYYYAVTWLEYVITEMQIQHIDTVDNVYSKASIYNLLASVYFKMNYIENAIEITDEILQFDPNNIKASRNKQYYSSILTKQDPIKIEKPVSKNKIERLHEMLCSHNTEVKSKEKCLYFPLREKVWFRKSDINAEVIRRKPLIVHFHGLIGSKTAAALKHMGHETLMNITSQYRFRYPQLSSGVNDRTHWRWVPKLKEKLYSMDISQMPPRSSKFNVMNVGLDGMIVKTQDMPSSVAGLFLISLVNRTLGGEVVIPLSKTKIVLERGDAVFVESQTQITICPVGYGSQWYGFQYLFEESYPIGVCPLKRRVRRGY